jgi:hypothetical protein
MSKNKFLLLFSLVCILFGLLAALMPFSDIDGDGLLDSLVTDDLVLVPGLCTFTGLCFLLTRLPTACLAAPQLFSSLLLPPPIFN